MSSFEYDMVVIGGGAAGLTAAGMSALLGAKTALIERHRLGGDCTWVGCVPSKTLIRAARAVHQMRTGERFGLGVSEPVFEFSKIMQHVRRVRQQIYEHADAPPNMERLGVEVVIGSAAFTDPHTVVVESRKLSSRFFVIATGSRPKTLGHSVDSLTNETVFELDTQPKRLLVVGAGPVGIEMAQTFARLGSEVIVADPGDGILRRDDGEHARILRECLSSEGVRFQFGRKVTHVEKGEYDAVLAAIGREPVVADLALDKAGVGVNDKGVVVDEHCRSSQRHIYAVGDVAGRFQFTHMAEHMSKVAVMNAILRWPKKLDEKHVVWCTFTEPELAHLGESEKQLRNRGAQFDVFRFSFRDLDRAVTDAETAGEVKVFANSRGCILGASILGVNAGEMISEYALAMRNGLRLSHIADTIHPYPTFLLGNRRAADQFVAKGLDSPLLEILGKVLGYRGQRKGSVAITPRQS